jgi:hypothetical protein
VARQAVAHRAVPCPAGSAAHRLAASRAAAGSFPEQRASCPVEVAFYRPAAAWRAQHWAMPAAAQKVAARREASVPDASVAVPDVSVGFRQAALPAPDGPAVPPLGASGEEGAAALDVPRRVAEAVASDAAAAPRPAVRAASDATEVRPRAAAAARDGGAAAEAAQHAAAVPREAAARAVAAVRRGAAAAARAVAVPRQGEVPGAAQALPAVRPSAAAWACRQDRLRPAAPQSKVRLAKARLAKARLAKVRLAPVRSVPEARSAHLMRCLLMRCLQMASRSARLLQAAQDGIWSWRSLFLESLL